MVKLHISYTKEDELFASEIAAMVYAKDPRRFCMKTPEPKDGVFHIYLNSRGKFRK